eukprot:2866502-Pleurochrysis_carterae.AAC.1
MRRRSVGNERLAIRGIVAAAAATGAAAEGIGGSLESTAWPADWRAHYCADKQRRRKESERARVRVQESESESARERE